MLQLVRDTVRFHWEAQWSTPANLLAAVCAMTLNNVLFLHGIWLMIFAGKEQNSSLLPYFLTAWGITATVWGLLNFFLGGLGTLGQLIEDGSLEPVMATPRNPLILLGLSASHPPALGDIVQGFLTFALVAYLQGPAYMLRGILMVPVVLLAFVATFIFAGSLAFFFSRGSSLASIIVESTLQLSTYPSGRIFEGSGRFILYLTPALATTYLPMEVVDQFSIKNLIYALAAAVSFLCSSVALFSIGIRRYRSGNYVGLIR